MSGFEVIGVIIGAIPVVTKLVKHFGTERNAPRQVERLSRMLEELKDERLLQSAMPTEQKHIRQMLDRCTDLMDKEMATGQRSRAWRFFWSAEAESRLKEHNDELDRELDRLQRRVHMFRMQAFPLPIRYFSVVLANPIQRQTTPPPTVNSPSADAPTPPLESKEFGSLAVRPERGWSLCWTNYFVKSQRLTYVRFCWRSF